MGYGLSRASLSPQTPKAGKSVEGRLEAQNFLEQGCQTHFPLGPTSALRLPSKG